MTTQWINAFAKPGHWACADPQRRVEWYAALGGNAIQTFAEPGDNSLPLPVDEYLKRGPAGFAGSGQVYANDRKISAPARFYRGTALR